MVPEFDQAVFAMQPGPDQRPGEDAVRLPHHQAGRQEAGHDAVARRSARSRLTDQLATQRAQAQAADSPRDLEQADHQAGGSRHGRAKAQGLTVQESGFFARDEPILGLGPSPEAGERARSTMKAGDGQQAAASPRGFVSRDGHRQAGPVRAEAGRSEGQGPRRGRQAEGARN